MDAIAGVSFRSPSLLWLLVGVGALFVFLLVRERVRMRVADRFVAESLRGRDTLRRVRPFLLSLGIAAAVVALAGPRRGFRTVETFRSEANTVILLDVSLSMNATDVGTSRLSAAKAVAGHIIEAAPGRVGLVIFEEIPEVVSPLTSDREAVAALLESIQSGELSEPGSGVESAIRAAVRVASAGGRESTEIVLISDGENRGAAPDDALKVAADVGIPIDTVTVGTEKGGEIPMPQGGRLEDESGVRVVTKAHRDLMQQIASRTGGRAFVNPFSEAALRSLEAVLESGKVGASDRTTRVPIERYQWPLGISMAMLLLGSLANRGAD